MVTLTHLAETLQTVLTVVADAIAHETRFVKRASKMTGAKFAQTLVFGWLDNPEATYEQLAQTATALGVPITAQGLEHRFTTEAAACPKGLLERAVQQCIAAAPVAIPLFQRFNGVYIQDSTTIPLPDALASEWQGCGGSCETNTQAALKLQVQLNLSDGHLTHLDLQAGRAQDKTAPMQTAVLPVGALRLADLGYFSIPTLAQYEPQGVFWLTRYDPRCLVLETDGRPIDWPTRLQLAAADRFDVPIQLSQRHQFRCRLVALRVPVEIAAERHRKAHAAARREGRTLNATQRALLDWTLFLTNVPATVLSLDEVVTLARVRWQIELLFKLWKAQGRVDESRSQNPMRLLCEVYAKLLGLLIQHWVLVATGWQHAQRSWFKAGQTIRQHSLRVGVALGSLVDLCGVFETLAACFRVGARLNPRKKRPNTVQRLFAFGEPA